jgi:hypothetical protein
MISLYVYISIGISNIPRVQVMILVCPKCNKEVKIISFGDGLIGICCDRILYDKKNEDQYIYMNQSENNDAQIKHPIKNE